VGIKRPGPTTNHLHTSNAEVRRLELYPHPHVIPGLQLVYLLLSSDSVNSGRCYVTPATYTHAIIEEQRFCAIRAATVAMQRCGEDASTTIVWVFCVVRAEELSGRQLALQFS
jgi:hypothetical protein